MCSDMWRIEPLVPVPVLVARAFYRKSGKDDVHTS
jgi:hypothetical protein